MAIKVGDVLDSDVNPFYQIIGGKGETNKIRLREGYSRSHVFTKGNTYKVSVKSPDVGEVRKNKRRSCMCIDIVNLFSLFLSFISPPTRHHGFIRN